jgi:thioredoxin
MILSAKINNKTNKQMAIIITDENFEAEIGGKDKPVLVDFFATWCEPCSVLGPILEKVAKDYEGRLVFAKANLDDIPLTAQKFGINQIPTVVLFGNGSPVSGFVGARPEEVVREWLEQFLKEAEKKVAVPAEKAQNNVEVLAREYADYSQKNGFKLNPSEESVKRIINGLLANEKKCGKKYCPCRRVSGNLEEDAKNVCPCVYHKDEIEKDGHCLCNLFVK